VDHAHQIDVEDPAPISERDVVYAASGTNSSVVAQDVDVAQGSKSRFGGVINRGWIGNVTHNATCLWSDAFQARQRGIQRPLFDVGEHRLDTRFGKDATERQTNAARAARYEGPFSPNENPRYPAFSDFQSTPFSKAAAAR